VTVTTIVQGGDTTKLPALPTPQSVLFGEPTPGSASRFASDVRKGLSGANARWKSSAFIRGVTADFRPGPGKQSGLPR
jgi:hypothetical protein